MADRPCPSCRAPRGSGKYLCLACWNTLPTAARRSLLRRDDLAMARLQELYGQVADGRALNEIEVTP